MAKLNIKFHPEGFSECLQNMSGEVQAAAEKIADRATEYTTEGSGFHVEMENEPRYKDAGFGVTRPVAYVVANDDASAAEEAENKILSLALGGVGTVDPVKKVTNAKAKTKAKTNKSTLKNVIKGAKKAQRQIKQSANKGKSFARKVEKLTGH